VKRRSIFLMTCFTQVSRPALHAFWLSGLNSLAHAGSRCDQPT
jgi:hypothetical protein